MLRITELALRDLIERIEQLQYLGSDELTDEMKETRLKFINDLRQAGKWDDSLGNWGNEGDAKD